MQEKQREEVALFRFGVISELVCSRLAPGEMSERIREKSRQRWLMPASGRTRIAESTIRRWISLYLGSDRQLTSLFPHERSDRGRSRRVDKETILSLGKLRKELPGLPVIRLLEEMEKRGLSPPGLTISLTTAYRIHQREGLSGKDRAAKIDRRRYEAQYPNDIWQSDVMHGPKVEVENGHRKAYLIGFLDDHSRLLPHAEFYLSEQLDSWLDAFRKKVRRRVTKDRTVSIDGRLFEAPTRFIGQQLSLLYHEYKADRVEIMYKGRSQGLLVPLDLAVNAAVHRDKPTQGVLPFMSEEQAYKL